MNRSGKGIPLEELRDFVAQSLPSAAILHSYLVRVRWDPALQDVSEVQQLSDNLIHELHHQMGLWGAILRLNMGDPTAVADVGLNLARFIYRRQAAMEAAERFPPAVHQNPQVRWVLAEIYQSNARIKAYWPVLWQTLLATGWFESQDVV